MVRSAPRHRTFSRPVAWLLLLGVATIGLVICYPRYQARGHWRAAQTAIEKEDFESARAHLALFERMRPEQPACLFQLARLARREGDYRTARAFLAKADAAGHPAPQIRLEERLTRIQQSGWDGTDAELAELLEAGSDDEARIREVLAIAYYRSFLLPAALEQANRWAEVEPGSASAWLLLGDIYYRLLDQSGASQSYLAAIERNPALVRARIGYGRVLLHMRRTADALTEFQEAWRLNPRDRDARLELIQALLQLNRIDEADSIVITLVVEFPLDPAVLGIAGSVAFEAGRLEEAEQCLRHATADKPDMATLIQFQHVLARRGKRKDAESVQLRIDRVKQDLDRVDAVTRTIRTSGDPAPRVEVGLILIRNGLHREGEAWLHDALRCDPQYGPAHAALADYYAARGQTDQAVHHRRLAGNP